MADINLNINAKNNASETIKRIASDTKGLEGQFKKLGSTIAGVFAAREVYKFAKEAINATKEFNSFARSIASTEMALGKFGSNASWKSVLNNVNGQVDGLKKMSNQYGVVINDVLSMRKELAEPLSFLDSNTINQLLPKLAAAGATMGISVGQMATEIDAVLDGRLKDRSSVLVKALGMDVGQVNKMGGQAFISELMRKLNSMESVFKDYAQSDEGKIAQFENQWNDFKITLGNALLPSLTTILESLVEPLENLKDAVKSDNFKSFIKTIGSMAGFAVEHPAATVAGIGSLSVGSDIIGSAVGTGISSAVIKNITLITSLLSKSGPIAATLAAMLLYTKLEFDILKEKTNIDIGDVLSDVFKIATSDSFKLEDLKTWNTLISMIPPKLKDFTDELNDAETYIGKFATNFSDAIDIISETNEKIMLENEEFFKPKPKKGEIDPITGYGTAYAEASAQAAEVYDRWMKKYEKATKIKREPIKVEISLKADMPYQASLSLTDSSGTQNKKIAPRVSDGRIIRG